MEKAKRFQPLAVLNQKLKGLDVFESNENTQPSLAGPSSRPLAPTAAASSSSQVPVPVSVPDSGPRPLDPDDVITKEHWQPRTFNDICLEPMCGKKLNATNGCVHCRKCGKLFCEEHTMYQMKLSRSAQHEPVRGLWSRVCETCYKSREGYNDHNGMPVSFIFGNGLLMQYRLGKESNRRIPGHAKASRRQIYAGNVSVRETLDTTHSTAGQSAFGADPVRREQALVDIVAERSTQGP